jgi:nitrate reductase gamma subunit
VFKALMGMMKKSPFTNADDKMGLVLTILADIQLLIGLVLYFMGALGLKNIQNMGMSNVMKNGMARFFAVEHITMMLIAIVLLHIGRAKSKRAAADASKHATSFWFYLIALLLILSSIPWPFRAGFESMRWF